MSAERRNRREPFVTLRTFVIVTLALIIAAVAAGLTYLSEPDLPQAVLMGGGAFAGACLFFHQIVQ